MNTHSNSASRNSASPGPDKPNSLGIAGDTSASVPVFACIIYIQNDEAGKVLGRVANLADVDADGISASGSSEREVLSKIVREFKARVIKMLEEKQEVSFMDPPQPPQGNEQVRSVPVHL